MNNILISPNSNSNSNIKKKETSEKEIINGKELNDTLNSNPDQDSKIRVFQPKYLKIMNLKINNKIFKNYLKVKI